VIKRGTIGTPVGDTMTAWVYYDVDGNRVREEDAAFKGKEVRVDSAVPAVPAEN
jgi:hypothetical protein